MFSTRFKTPFASAKGALVLTMSDTDKAIIHYAFQLTVTLTFLYSPFWE